MGVFYVPFLTSDAEQQPFINVFPCENRFKKIKYDFKKILEKTTQIFFFSIAHTSFRSLAVSINIMFDE